jgi:hypothetical protein
VWDWFPFAVNEVSHRLGGEELKMPGSSHTISIVGPEQPHWFSLSSINSEVFNCSPCFFILYEFRRGSPFPTIDPEVHPAPMHVMASGDDDNRCSHSGGPAVIVTYCRPIVRGWAPPPIVLHRRPGESPRADVCLGSLLHHDIGLCLLTGVGPRFSH